MALVGCRTPDTTGQARVQDSTPGQNYDSQQPEYSYRYPDAPPVVDAFGFREFVSGFRPSVVLIECWASWSRKSREDLARLSDFHSQHHDNAMRVISCNFDPQEDWSTRTVPILQSTGANFPCVVIPRQARARIRDWLDPDWSYDLPARFIVDSHGRVIFRSASSTPLETVLARARQWVSEKTRIVPVSKSYRGATILRSRLVNVATGDTESLPVTVSESGRIKPMVQQIASYITSRLNRSEKQRIAILPFLRPTDQRTASPIGMEVARKLRASLQAQNSFDLIGPIEAAQMIAYVGISSMAIDEDPAVARGRLGVDYLIIGRIYGERTTERTHTAIATDRGVENANTDPSSYEP